MKGNMSKKPKEFKTIKTFPKDERFVSMVIHNDRVYVASMKGVYIVESVVDIESKERFEYLRRLSLVTG